MRNLFRSIATVLAFTLLPSTSNAADQSSLTFVNDIPFVGVVVGMAKSNMMIDSGGSLLISIPQSTITESKSVDLLEEKNKFRDISGKEYSVQKLVARDVVVGSTKLEPIAGQVHVQWGGAPEGPNAPLTIARKSGALGIGAFGNRKVLLDYHKKVISVYEPSEFLELSLKSWIKIPMEYGNIGPNVTLNVSGKQRKLILDTGAQLNLVNADTFGLSDQCSPSENDSVKCDVNSVGTVSDAAGNQFGELSALRIDLKNAPFDGILGAPFFREYRVIFDVAGKHIYISASAKE